MCYHPIHIKHKNLHPSPAFPENYIEMDVPCGKCIQCIKRRQIDYAARLYREAKSAANMFFVTLTYNDNNIPIASNFYRCCVDTGEVDRVETMKIVTDDDMLFNLRGIFKDLKASSKPRYVTRYICGSDGKPLNISGFNYYVDFTPSLFREDVKNWIKGCRVQYERDFGSPLTFRVAWCGEYGPRGCRPHYHLVFLNLTKEQMDYMSKRWNKGYTYTKYVPSLNVDGTDARLLACRYIGKYVSKGKFDCDSVTRCDAQKGRLCNSKRFGTSDFSDEELSYYRAYDLYGVYDLDTMSLYLPKDGNIGRLLKPEEIDSIVKEVYKRAFYSIQVKGNTLHIPLPKAFRNYIFYVEDWKLDSNEKRKIKYKVYRRASALSRFVMDYVQSIADADNEREFKEFCASRNLSEDDFDSRIAFEEYNENSEKNVSEGIEEDDFFSSLMRDSEDYQ